MIMLILTAGCQLQPIQPARLEAQQSLQHLSVQQLTQLSALSGPEVSPTSLFSAMQQLEQAEKQLLESEKLRSIEEEDYITLLEQKKQQAALELQLAEQALQRAKDLREAAEMEHLAYLAERQSEIARRIARRKRVEIEQQELLDSQVAFLQEINRLQDDMLAEQLHFSEQRATQLQSRLFELENRQSERGLILSFGDAFFDFDAANLPDDVLRNLDRAAEFLNERTVYNVLIESHTDNVGGEEYNLLLSQQRAEFARTELIKRGVSPSRIIAKGHGASRPIANNDTPIGRQKNRRVEMIILNRSRIE